MTVLNAFSVDLEDWYQAITSLNARPEEWPRHESRVVGNTQQLLKLLKEHNVRATFFVLGRVADEHPDLIRAIHAAGHEIGVHGYWHRMVHRMDPASFSEEMDRALGAIQPLVDQPILGHRAPYFSINRSSLWALDVLAGKGFRYDSSFFPTRNTLYGFPDAPRFPHRRPESELMEFPLSTARWMGLNVPIAGGLYLRAFPYQLIRAGIRQLNRQGHPAVIYMHPWELDTGHRYSRVTPREFIVQYTRRGSLAGKLRRLFRDFSFAPLRQLLEPGSLPQAVDASTATGEVAEAAAQGERSGR